MKTIFIFAAALLFCVSSASAQDWARQSQEKSPRHQEWVQIKHDNRTVHAFVVYPETKGKATAVVLIHEIFGLSDWARSMGDQLAAAGYIAIVPDMLSGFGPNGGKSSDFPNEGAAREANSKLDQDVVVADLNATADYVKKLPASNGKIVVAGFCWGGTQSFNFATKRKDLSAAFVFYGGPPKDFSGITAPVYGFYAGDDGRIGETIPGAIEGMKQAGKKYEPVTYDGAGHGFMRAGEDPANEAAIGKPGDDEKSKKAHDRAVANKKARAEAWDRWMKLMKGI